MIDGKEDSQTVREYHPKRNDLACYGVCMLAGGVIACAYNVEVEHADRLRQCAKEGFVLLPKHQSMIDIPLECVLLRREIGRYAYYVMKSGLPGILGYLGGISASRGKDISSIADRSLRKESIRTARRENGFFYTALVYHMRSKDILVVHPEGTRNYQCIGRLNRSALELLLEAQQDSGRLVPFVPLDIEYGKRSGIRRDVLLRVEEQIVVGRGDSALLCEHMKKHIHLIE